MTTTTRLKLLIIASLCITGLLNGMQKTSVSALYSTGTIDTKLENGVTTAYDWDSGCRNYLGHYRSSGYSLRQIINGVPPTYNGSDGAAYASSAWLSESGVPNTSSPTKVAYGKTSVNLQVNAVTFLCGSVVATDKYGASPNQPAAAAGAIADENYRWVGAANANDRYPNVIGGSNMQPALVDTRTRIDNATVVSGGGSVIYAAGSVLAVNRTDASRYWFAPPVGVTWTAPSGGIKTITTLTIEIKYRRIAGYHNYEGLPGRVEECSNGASVVSATNVAFDQCELDTTTLTIILKPPLAVPLDGVKIDDSGVGRYGGNYDSVGLSGTDTGTHKFSDDVITAVNTTTAVSKSGYNANPFKFEDCKTGCATSYDSHLSAGTYKFTSTDTAGNNGAYILKGFKICDSSNPPAGGCTSAWLADTTNGLNANGASVTIAEGGDYHMRWIYGLTPNAVVSLTCSRNSGTYTIAGTATDSSKPGAQLALKYYVNGILFATTYAQTTTTGSFGPIDITSYLQPPPKSATFKVVATGVDATGAADGGDGSATTTCTSTAVGGTPTNCPGDPIIAANTKVDVLTPDLTPLPQVAPGASSTNANDSYTQYTSQQKNPNVSITDVSGGVTNQSVLPALVSDTTYGKITLDYQPYVTGYPYDPNQAAITYNSIYNQTDWYTNGTPDAPSTCDKGYGSVTGTGATCTYTGTATHWTCPSGYGNGSSSICTQISGSLTTAGTADTWSCNAGDSGGGASSGCSYPATHHYRWYSRPPIVGLKMLSGPVSAYAMKACFERGFNVTAVTVTSTSFDDPEDPTSVTAGGSAKADFVIPPGYPAAPNGLRNAVSVNGLTTDASASGYACPVDTTNNSFSGGLVLPFTGVNSTLAPYNCSVSAPPLVAGNKVCVTYTMSPAMGQVDLSGIISPTYVAPSGSVSSSLCTNPLTNQPYANFYGLDVSAGGEFDTASNSCLGSTNTSTGDIAGFVKGLGGPLTRGSSAQYGALANGSVNLFGSASLRPDTVPTPDPTAPSGLTFANNGANGQLGVVQCIPNYFATKDSATTKDLHSLEQLSSRAAVHNSSSPTPQQYWFVPNGGHLTIKSPPAFGNPRTIHDGNRIAIYVEGDVYIANNITYQNSSWGSLSDVPSFYLIVKGKINIDPAVTELDGVYISQKDTATGLGGTINTCANGFSDYTFSNLYNNCSANQLTINGAFIAQHVRLSRTYASLRNSFPGEQPVGSGDCTLNTSHGTPLRTSANYDCAAEVFKTSPDIFLTMPATNPTGGTNKGKYDYITTLSPVL